jgi:hypothetical protein
MNPLRLTPRDLGVLELLGDHRFLDARQVALHAFPSEDAARRRLQELSDHKLVHRLYMPVRPYDRHAVDVFGLAARGARHLPRAPGARPPCVTTTTERRSGLFLDHTLRRNDVRLAITRLSELHPRLTLLDWRQRREDVQLVVRDHRHRRHSVVPDGVAIVRQGSEVEVLAIEVDLNTVPVKRMARRYRAYWQDFTGGGPRVRFGRCGYRVLTIGSDPARLSALRRAAQQAPTRGRRASRLFWFAPLSTFDPANPTTILSATFIHAGYTPGGEAPAPERLWPSLTLPPYDATQGELPPGFERRALPGEAPTP